MDGEAPPVIMLGLFGTLNMANRSLQTQRNATEVAGHNLANVNTPGYSRQRVAIATSITIQSEMGYQGTGADAIAVVQIRDRLLDRNIVGEKSVRAAYEGRQRALQFTQAALGQAIDRQSAGTGGAGAISGVDGPRGLSEEFSAFFAALQGVSAKPTSTAERQSLVIAAENLATQFNQVARRFDDLRTSLNDSIVSDTEQANVALADIAKLNAQIIRAEIGTDARANDLRDSRQKRLEELAQYVQVDTVEQADGGLDISIGGVQVVDGGNVLDQLEAFDAGGGQYLVRTQTGGATLNLGGGTLQGTIDARDNDLAALRADLDTLAGSFVTQVNGLHAGGFGLTGTTGAAFFTGTNAADIALNASLADDPALIQASGVAGEVGDNTVAAQLAQLGGTRQATLGNQTFLEYYGQTVGRLGQSLNSLNTQLANQDVVEQMLLRQRDSVSGVSLDEEMTDLVRFQRAFEASARLITTIDDMLETVVNLKR